MPLVKRKTRKQQKSRIKKRTTKSRRKSKSMKGGYDGIPTECNPPCVKSKNQICTEGLGGKMKCLNLPDTPKGRDTLERYWERNKDTPQYNQ